MSNFAETFIVAACIWIIIFCSQFVFKYDFNKQDLEVTCTWDIPAEQLGADLPPLPVKKGNR